MILKICAFAALLALHAYADRSYTTKYDDVDLDEILASSRLLDGYIRCLMDEAPCTADAKELKKNLPDAITNGCIMCSEKQREGSAKVMHYIIDHRPDDWTRLEAVYDTEGAYRKAYLESKNTTNNKSAEENTEKTKSITHFEPTTEKDR